MKGIEKIIARLESDARTEIDALGAEAKAECDGILAGFREQAEAAYGARMQEGRQAVALREERLQSASELEARKQLLGFKQELVSGVFARAAERLAQLPKAEYVSFLAAQAAKAASSGTEELIFNAKDAKSVGADVVKAANEILGGKGRLTLSPETRDIPGGVVVKQGDIEANCAIDMLVQLRRSDLASQVAEILFA